jgi:hypothetical protein
MSAFQHVNDDIYEVPPQADPDVRDKNSEQFMELLWAWLIDQC